MIYTILDKLQERTELKSPYGADPVVVEEYQEYVLILAKRLLAGAPKADAPEEVHREFAFQVQQVRCLHRAVQAWDAQARLLEAAETELKQRRQR